MSIWLLLNRTETFKITQIFASTTTTYVYVYDVSLGFIRSSVDRF